MSRLVDLTKKEFGRLTVLEQSGWYTRENGSRIATWKCQCICGNIVTTPTSDRLASGRAQSCGCLQKEKQKTAWRRNPQEMAWDYHHKKYIQMAKERGYIWDLTKEQFKELAKQSCFYCGAEPKPYVAARTAYLNTIIKQGGTPDLDFADKKVILANGVDRIDNTKGYILTNCNSSCFSCNMSKSDKTLQEFEEWAIRLADAIQKRRNA